MVFARLVAAVVVTLLGPGAGDPEEAVVVETSLGAVRGERRATDSGKMVDVWASIPFAEPPVGKLRLEESLNLLILSSTISAFHGCAGSGIHDCPDYPVSRNCSSIAHSGGSFQQ